MAAADQEPMAAPLPEDDAPLTQDHARLSEGDAPPPEGSLPEGGLPEGGVPEDGAGPAAAGPGAGPEAVLAEPGQRLLARIVDTLVVGLPVLLVISEFLPSARVEIVAPPVVAGLLLIYEWVQLALWGRTLGKRFAGIQVVRQTFPAGAGETTLGTDPCPPGLVRSLLRTAVFTVPIAARPVPVFGLLAGLVWVGNAALMFEGSWRQALHDRVSGTVVVKEGAA